MVVRCQMQRCRDAGVSGDIPGDSDLLRVQDKVQNEVQNEVPQNRCVQKGSRWNQRGEIHYPDAA
jgi:hypothetical protein